LNFGRRENDISLFFLNSKKYDVNTIIVIVTTIEKVDNGSERPKAG
jgi:hypothetical protein